MFLSCWKRTDLFSSLWPNCAKVEWTILIDVQMWTQKSISGQLVSVGFLSNERSLFHFKAYQKGIINISAWIIIFWTGMNHFSGWWLYHLPNTHITEQRPCENRRSGRVCHLKGSEGHEHSKTSLPEPWYDSPSRWPSVSAGTFSLTRTSVTLTCSVPILWWLNSLNEEVLP